jgi:hypothetical protein
MPATATASRPISDAFVNVSAVGICGPVRATIELPVNAQPTDSAVVVIETPDATTEELACRVMDLERMAAALATAIAAAKRAGALQ